MSNDFVRKRKFLEELDSILTDTIDDCIDEEGNEIPSNYTEEMVYNTIMKNEEYHFLGTDYVCEMIHKFMQDFSYRMKTLRKYGLT